MGRPRPTVGHPGTAGVRLTPQPSYDPAAWSPASERDVEAAVGVTRQLLRAYYPDHYAEPAGYPGAEALLEGARAEPGSSFPSGAGQFQDAREAVSRPAPGASRAPGSRQGRKQTPGSGRSSRDRPAKGS
jgi:hypothetical protein